jgi:hypothetical protein
MKLVFRTKAEADHFARLLKEAGFTPTIELTARNVTVTSAASPKRWREVVLKYNKQRQIQAATANNGQKLML